MIARWRAPTVSADLAGPLWMLGAVVAFTVMSLIMKHLAASLPAMVIAFLRLLLALVLIAPLVSRRPKAALRTRRLAAHAALAFVGVAALACFLLALGSLTLADAMALSFTNPLWSIPISVLLLGEPVRIRRWTATAVGFVGVLFIVRPQGAIQPAMLLALASAVFTALSLVVVKRLTTSESPLRITFYYSLIGSLLTAIPAAAAWEWPSGGEFAWLGAIALAGLIGQICHARAFARADVTRIAPLDFLRPPLAAILGVLALGEIPDAWTVTGIVIIAAASAYIAWREAVLRRPWAGTGASGGS